MKTKNIFLLALTLLTSLSLRAEIIASGYCGADPNPDDGNVEYGQNLTWQLTDGGTLTISGSGEMFNTNYSDVYYFMPWNNNYSSDINSVVFSGNITSVGPLAFYQCSSLTSVTIPESVTSFGDWAFQECSSLTDIDIPASLTYVGHSVFSGTNINKPLYNSHVFVMLPRYHEGAYSVPAGIKAIAGGAFLGCTWLTSVTIPEGVTSIGYQTFQECSSLTSVTIPESVTSIGGKAFYQCCNLTSVAIPEGVTYIGYQAFYQCYSLTSVAIPEGVTYIGYQAFQECSSLTSVAIPEGVTSIGYQAFQECSSLTSVTIHEGVTYIGYRAFYYCSSLTSVTIHEGVTSIDDGAFQNCISLADIDIPASLTSVGFGVFLGTQINKPLYNSHVFVMLPYDHEGAYSVPAGIKAIAGYAFLGCTGLTELTIPESVESIAYEESSALDINYPELKKITCHAKPDDMGWMRYLLHCAPNVTDITSPAFEPAGSMDKLERITVTAGTMPDHLMRSISENCFNLRSVDLAGAENTVLTHGLFEEKPMLETIVLPANLESVPYKMAMECLALKSVAIPASVTEIGTRAFENCRKLTEVLFDDGSELNTIGDWAFYNCHELKDVVIPEGVTELGSAVFYGCTYLENVGLPASLRSIGDNAFALCSKMQKMTVLAAVPPAVEARTFEEVSRSMPVYVPESSLDDYRNAEYWKELNIVAVKDTPTGAENIGTDGLYRLDGSDVILAEDMPVAVYTASGALVYSGTTRQVTLPSPGIYIMRIAGQTVKIQVTK